MKTVTCFALLVIFCVLDPILIAQGVGGAQPYFSKHRASKIITGATPLPFPGAVTAKSNTLGDGPSIEWDSSVIQITNDSLDNFLPQIRSYGGNVYLMWDVGFNYFTVSTNHGVDWNPIMELNGYSPPFIWGMGLISANKSNIYYITEYDTFGIERKKCVWLRASSNKGVSWDSGRSILYGEPVSITSYKNKIIVAYSGAPADTTFLMHFTYSSDWGTTWQFVDTIIPLGSIVLKQIDSVLYLVKERNSYYDLGCPVSEVEFNSSDDFLETWSNNAVLSTQDCITSDMPALDSDTSGNVYVVWRDGKYGSITGWGGTIIFRRSTDYGKTWGPEKILTTRLTGMLPKISVDGSNVLVSWTDEDTSGGREIHKAHCRFSTNYGTTWSQEYDASDIRRSRWQVDIDGTTSDGYVYIVFASEDSIPGHVAQLFIRRGILKTSGIISYPPLFPQRMELIQCYPNPFNSSTEIRFRLSNYENIRLQIVDILGRVVATLADRNFQPGEHSIVWDASHVSSGIYLAVLRNGSSMLMEKLLLVK
jgi:hypothetical protein